MKANRKPSWGFCEGLKQQHLTSSDKRRKTALCDIQKGRKDSVIGVGNMPSDNTGAAKETICKPEC